MALLHAAHEDVGGDIVSGGGTGTFDINVWCTEIQAGSYALMDTAYAELGLPFRQALWVEATVISVSPKGWFVADCGLKALGMDHGDPTRRRRRGAVLLRRARHRPARAGRRAARSATASASGPRTSTRRSRCTSAMHLADGDDIVETWEVDLRGWQTSTSVRVAATSALVTAPAYARPMTDDFATLDATAQAELVRTGQASPLELVDAAINRIEKLNPELNAVIHPLFERARAKRPRGDAARRPVPRRADPVQGPRLRVEGEPYHEGMKLLKDADYRPPHTDNLAQKYFDAGFVVVGRTNTPELGLVPTTEPVAYGPTHNPWKLGTHPGGSWGGSAAAVASGMVPVAHANDGGGSIRIPASCCGLVGLKPTRGRTSTGPDLNDISQFLVAELCVSRTVRDTAGVLDAVHGPFPGDATQAPPPRGRTATRSARIPGKLQDRRSRPRTRSATRRCTPDCVAAAEATAQAARVARPHGRGRRRRQGFDNDELIMQFGAVWAADCSYLLERLGQEGRPAGHRRRRRDPHLGARRDGQVRHRGAARRAR